MEPIRSLRVRPPESAQPLVGADLERVFYAERGRLVRLAFLLVEDPGVAEELVQEAFLLAHRRLDQLREEAALPTYLRSTVINLARSRFRRLRVARRHPPLPEISTASPDEQFLVSEDHREVLNALDRLPRRQRECLVLRYYLELSEAEIAATLGISPGSVKSHAHRGLAALAQCLEAPR